LLVFYNIYLYYYSLNILAKPLSDLSKAEKVRGVAMSDKQKVFEYLENNKDEMVDFLCKFLEFKSINAAHDNVPSEETSPEWEVQNWLKGKFKEFGFDKIDVFAADPQEKRPNIVGTIGNGNKEKSLILNGHVDVVPIPEEQKDAWTVDPWKPTIKNGNVYGRGASDMKGGVTGMIWAAKALIDCDIDVDGNVYVAPTAAEESASPELGVLPTIERYKDAAFAIVTEPTNCEIHSAMNSLMGFELHVKGKDVHIGERNLTIFPQPYGTPAGPEVGVNAIGKMMLFLELFRRLEVQWNFRWRHKVLGSGGYPKHTDQMGVGVFNINPSIIRGGSYTASLAGWCEVVGRVLYPPWISSDTIVAELKEHIAAIASTDDWLKENPPEFVGPTFKFDGIDTPVDHPGCQTLASSFVDATHKEATFSGMKCVSEVTHFVKNGIPAVVFGPGAIFRGCHGIDEHVPIEQLVEHAKTLAAMIINWCG
jgi:acetylornithine deacetylase/succinyl-diaminopimelate desuccinylase family protein